MLRARTIDTARPLTASKRLRVTMLGSLPPTKGVSPYTAELVDALAARPDVDLEVLAFKSIYPRRLYPGGDPDEPGAERKFPGVRVRRFLTWYNPLGWVWAGLSLRGEVIHAQWWSYVLAPVYATVLGIARLRGKKVLVTVHNVEPHERSRVKRALNGLVFRFADGFVVHSVANRAALAARVAPDAAIEVVPIAAAAALASVGRAAARSQLGIDLDDHVVLNFGNIRPYKGLDVLLRAWARVVEFNPKAQLLIVGQPWGSFEPYDRLIGELGIGGRVRTVLDYVPATDVPLYFGAADLVALPYTHFDAQSAVGAQTLAYSRAMVVSDVGGLPDLVISAECVVPAGNAKALADAIVSVLTDPPTRERLEKEVAAVAAEFSAAHVSSLTAAVYAKLTG